MFSKSNKIYDRNGFNNKEEIVLNFGSSVKSGLVNVFHKY
jgi:hypothetical protein